MDILKEPLANDIYFILAIIEGIIILFLVIYILSRRRDAIDDSYQTDQNNPWMKKYNIVYEELLELRKEKQSSIQGKKSQVSTYNPNEHINKTTVDANNPHYGSCSGKETNPHMHETKSIDGTDVRESSIDVEDKKTVSATITTRYEYLEAANSGQFRRLLSSDEKCFFRTWEDNGIRKFEFHGNVDRALANINAIFDETCEIEGKQNGATNIINVEPGILDSKLKVETKAKIKLI